MTSTPPKKESRVSIEQRNELATSYLPIVRKIAMGLSTKAPPSVTFDDLVGAGLIGLMDAASRFDPEKREQFGAFVATRVRGAMIDELRNNDPLSRDLRFKSNKLTKTIHNLTHEIGRQPSEEEISEKMGLSLNEYHTLLVQLQQATFLSPVNVEQALETSKGFMDTAPGNPQDSYLFAELTGRLARAIAKLTEKEQRILSMYYKDELSLKEIGDRFGVTDSRACQVRTQAIHRLKALLEEEDNG
ncbi:MAG: FliA/WhiG family RNA polymerase sigma factor [Deltaproteobacteria bacterium]|nr:FliA/WhiG family RNA polymerase sigma factor [Deltaproteobacteria bacterium]MBN2674740.1 FliA/WhiG family RNA polymerase sigma factor [Deltaproteobacteria bacterium]